ncbi:MAG: HPP family protein, partial [Acetobacter cibinongensis]
LMIAAGFGACLAIIVTMAVTGWVEPASLPALVAPIGASSVLVFAIPASPLASPRAVIGGNTLSALLGIMVGLLITNPFLAAGVAVGLAIVAMAATGTLHPPGGAAALTAVLLHPQTLDLEAVLAFPFIPVFLNSAILVGVGLLFHRISGHSYPHKAAPLPPQPATALHIQREDVLSALENAEDVFDIAVGDLERLLVLAEQHAHARQALP